jgi:hypothetical protein
VATRDVFSDAELDQLRGFPEINRVELIRYFTLTPADAAFVQAHRSMDNRFGVVILSSNADQSCDLGIRIENGVADAAM